MGNITAPRFKGHRQFGLCLDGARMTEEGFDANGNLAVDEPNDPDTVAEIQRALTELDFPVPISGVYDADTADMVRKFKIAQNLAIPPGLVAHDGVLGPGTSKRLNELFTPPPGPVVDPELRYTDRKSFYTNRALAKANDGNHLPWDPDQGYLFNRPRIVDLYGYYRDLYLSAPDLFLWAGLGRMAGGAVVGGLDADPGFADQTVMVRIGRDIFFDLAAQEVLAALDRMAEEASYGPLGWTRNSAPRDASSSLRYLNGASTCGSGRGPCRGPRNLVSCIRCTCSRRRRDTADLRGSR
ncbi:peptidoglycan-binding protein [Nocardia sp. NPDC052566]|uniref:peptidoglycan-binding protein n=1 Tax=Nocardia sp. NPDC052566 TaxID=3364330 RepID=UPI0037C9D6FE